MSNVTFELTMTRSVEYTHSFEMNEKHAENAIAKYGSMLEYKRSKNDLAQFRDGNAPIEGFGWKKTTYPDEWTAIQQEFEPKSYEVTIRGEIEKTISLDAMNKNEAELEARHIFENQDRPDISAIAGETLKIEVVI